MNCSKTISACTLFSLSVLVLLLSACGGSHSGWTDPDAPPPLLEQLVGTDSALFRGLNLGETPDAVREKEGHIPEIDEKEHQVYSQLLHPQGEFRLEYTFGKAGLYEILVDISMPDRSVDQALFDDLKGLLTKRYGAPKAQDRTFTWNVANARTNDLEIILTHKSEDQGIGRIDLSFYDYDN